MRVTWPTYHKLRARQILAHSESITELRLLIPVRQEVIRNFPYPLMVVSCRDRSIQRLAQRSELVGLVFVDEWIDNLAKFAFKDLRKLI